MRSHHLHYSALALALAAALAAAIPARAHAQQVIADGDEQTPVASCARHECAGSPRHVLRPGGNMQERPENSAHHDGAADCRDIPW